MTDVYCKECHYCAKREDHCNHYNNVEITKTRRSVTFSSVYIWRDDKDLNKDNNCPNYKERTTHSVLFGDRCSLEPDIIEPGEFAPLIGIPFLILSLVAACMESFGPLYIWGVYMLGLGFVLKHYIDKGEKYRKKIEQHNTSFTPEDPIWDEIAAHMNPSSSPKAEEVINLLDKVDDIVDRRESHV